jgi:DNA-directed RNA polymerase II subunit RPB1
MRHGFSVGIEDCESTTNELIQTEIERCLLQAKSVMETEMDLEVREARILKLMNEATDIGDRIAKNELKPDNNMVSMVVSGAKGKMFNIINSVSAIGQQNLCGRRVPKDYGGRSLPCYPITNTSQYEPDEIPISNNSEEELEQLKNLFQSRGFIFNCFYHGLEPQELFFLSAGGREGLIDSAVKTAKCGYFSRRVLKKLEDLKVSYGGQVTNSSGTIIQFAYGDDNYNAAELIKTGKSGYQCADVKHIIQSLNKDYEWAAAF